jgi:hypothetical protein
VASSSTGGTEDLASVRAKAVSVMGVPGVGVVGSGGAGCGEPGAAAWTMACPAPPTATTATRSLPYIRSGLEAHQAVLPIPIPDPGARSMGAVVLADHAHPASVDTETALSPPRYGRLSAGPLSWYPTERRILRKVDPAIVDSNRWLREVFAPWSLRLRVNWIRALTRAGCRFQDDPRPIRDRVPMTLACGVDAESDRTLRPVRTCCRSP